MDFYRFIKGEYDREEFKKEFYEYVDNWEKIPKYLSIFENKFFDLYDEYKKDKINGTKKKEIITKIKAKKIRFNGLF